MVELARWTLFVTASELTLILGKIPVICIILLVLIIFIIPRRLPNIKNPLPLQAVPAGGQDPEKLAGLQPRSSLVSRPLAVHQNSGSRLGNVALHVLSDFSARLLQHAAKRVDAKVATRQDMDPRCRPDPARGSLEASARVSPGS